MAEIFKISLIKKIDKTAEKIIKYEKRLTPLLKVRFLYTMFKRLHSKGKMCDIDDNYWKENLAKKFENELTCCE